MSEVISEMLPDPGAGDAAGREREPSVGQLAAAVVDARGPRVEPEAHARVNLDEQLGGHHRAASEQSRAQDHVGLQPRRDPQQRDEEGEQQECETDVVLGPEHGHRDAPREEDRQQDPRWHDVHSTEALGRRREQFAVGCEVRGEEEDEQDLGDLDGLEGDGSHDHPQASTVDVLAEVGDERHHQQAHRSKQRQVAVAVEVAHVTHDSQGHDQSNGADQEPDRLVAGANRIPPGDLDVAHPVEQGRDRQQQLGGVGGESPHRDVHHE
jgi:hypothetical protein